ncbi:MAG: hopanoid biosynthesis associated radical SAM protein HpnJ [Acidobacteriota bacterium]|nr:hopanoid biosynthesis associated radical SAM protein HpnJ [Acidobacteriota bacterium]
MIPTSAPGPADKFVRTLFLNPPSYAGFDGGAGARYQARREVRSFWYPTWLAQPAALVPGSRLVDAPARGLSLADVLVLARDYDLVVMHTSTPSFPSDVRVAEHLKADNPDRRVGFVGAHVAVSPEESLRASRSIDFVARKEFDYTVRDVARGLPYSRIDGLSYRDGSLIVHRPERAVIENMDDLPFVTDVYARDLVIEDYFIGYLLHPYVSLYTGRGCRSFCSFCLWPQTIGGHRYRTRSAAHVEAEIASARERMPQVKEWFFDDDTFTDDEPRARDIARRMGKLGVTWSCNAKPIVSRATLAEMKENGLRLLLVGYESGNQKILNNIRKGVRLDIARRFSEDCRQLGILIHGTFIVGLPGETTDTIEETVRFARQINPHTIQVSLAAPYRGTELYRQAIENGWLSAENDRLVGDDGIQVSTLSYPNLSSGDIARAMERFYKRFYLRPRKIAEMVQEMVATPGMTRRRLREGAEFFRFLSERKAQT